MRVIVTVTNLTLLASQSSYGISHFSTAALMMRMGLIDHEISLLRLIPPSGSSKYAGDYWLKALLVESDLLHEQCEIFCEAVPKAAEVCLDIKYRELLASEHAWRPQNFLALCASGAYDNCLFHRFVFPLLRPYPHHTPHTRSSVPFLPHRLFTTQIETSRTS